MPKINSTISTLQKCTFCGCDKIEVYKKSQKYRPVRFVVHTYISDFARNVPIKN